MSQGGIHTDRILPNRWKSSDKNFAPSVIERCTDVFPFVLYKPEVWFKSFASGRVYVIITSRRNRESEISDGWENIEIATFVWASIWCNRFTQFLFCLVFML